MIMVLVVTVCQHLLKTGSHDCAAPSLLKFSELMF